MQLTPTSVSFFQITIAGLTRLLVSWRLYFIVEISSGTTAIFLYLRERKKQTSKTQSIALLNAPVKQRRNIAL